MNQELGAGGYMHTVHELEDVLCCDILKIPYLLYISNVLTGISCLVITLLRQYPLPGYIYILYDHNLAKTPFMFSWALEVLKQQHVKYLFLLKVE